MKLQTLTAGQLMQVDIEWAMPDETLRSAARRMREERLHCLLVRMPEGRLPGIVSAKDLVQLVGLEGMDSLDRTRVEHAMSAPAVCVQKETPLIDCIGLMSTCSVRRLPVLDGGGVVGILSSTDVFDHIVELPE